MLAPQSHSGACAKMVARWCLFVAFFCSAGAVLPLKRHAVINGTAALHLDDDHLRIEFDAFGVHYRLLLHRSLADDNDETVKRETKRSGGGQYVRPMVFSRLDGLVERVRVDMGSGWYLPTVVST